MAYSVFLSHTRADKAFARQLFRDLTTAGVEVWFDEAEIRIGDSIVDKIGKGIEEADFLAVVLSPDSVESPWVKKEIQVATHQEIMGKSVKVLPILYKDCTLPAFLQDKAWADFRDGAGYWLSLGALVERLNGDTTRLTNTAVKFRRAIVRVLCVLRDVVLINVLTGVSGFTLGLAGVPMTATASGVSQFLFMVVGFCISAMLTPLRTGRHLLTVAIAVWCLNFVGVLTQPDINVVIWLINFFPIIVTMGVGRGLAAVLARTSRLLRERVGGR